MSDDTVFGLARSEWAASFRPGLTNYYCDRFTAVSDSNHVRIAFGNHGPPIDELGNRGDPTFMGALVIPPSVAIDLFLYLYGVVPENVRALVNGRAGSTDYKESAP